LTIDGRAPKSEFPTLGKQYAQSVLYQKAAQTVAVCLDFFVCTHADFLYFCLQINGTSGTV
jgi:hypothetical protein